MQAIKDGVARIKMTWKEAYDKASKDIEHDRALTRSLMDTGFIKEPPMEMVQKSLDWAIEQMKKAK
jgi:malate dehydrogenase (oxaloacetate-decarboxylating)